jgi:hypothetical protein
VRATCRLESCKNPPKPDKSVRVWPSQQAAHRTQPSSPDAPHRRQFGMDRGGSPGQGKDGTFRPARVLTGRANPIRIRPVQLPRRSCLGASDGAPPRRCDDETFGKVGRAWEMRICWRSSGLGDRSFAFSRSQSRRHNAIRSVRASVLGLGPASLQLNSIHLLPSGRWYA